MSIENHSGGAHHTHLEAEHDATLTRAVATLASLRTALQGAVDSVHAMTAVTEAAHDLILVAPSVHPMSSTTAHGFARSAREARHLAVQVARDTHQMIDQLDEIHRDFIAGIVSTASLGELVSRARTLQRTVTDVLIAEALVVRGSSYALVAGVGDGDADERLPI